MDSLQLRDMILQIGKDFNCPACGYVVPHSHMDIEIHGEANCSIVASCANCHEKFTGFAAAVPKDTAVSQLFNASSVVTKNQILQQEIKQNDADIVRQTLTNISSFTDIFPEQKDLSLEKGATRQPISLS